MSATVEQVGWTLVHFLWQGAIVGLVMGAVLACLRRRSAQTRYVVACVGLAAMAACPVATLAWMKTHVRRDVAGKDGLAVGGAPVKVVMLTDVVDGGGRQAIGPDGNGGGVAAADGGALSRERRGALLRPRKLLRRRCRGLWWHGSPA